MSLAHENSKIVDLGKASEVDEELFWKLLKKGKQPMCTTLKTANFILEQCFISGRITKLREAGQVQARSGMSH